MNKSLGSICLGAIMAMAFSYHAAAADLPEIEKSGTLKVATEDDYAPFNFMNNGQADGFNKDSTLTRAFCRGPDYWRRFPPGNTIWR